MMRDGTPVITTLADIEALEKSGDFLKSAPASTYEIIADGARIGPDRLAMRFLPDPSRIDARQDWTFSELLRRIRQAANCFRDLGAEADVAVSIILPNCPAYHAALWGAQTAAIANPVNPLLEPEHMAEIMKAAGAKILVTCYPGDAQGIGARALAAAATVPTLSDTLLVDVETVRGPVSTAVKTSDWDAETSRHSGDALVFTRENTVHAPATYFHTGGTTGAPKLAVLTHGNMIAAVIAARYHLPMPETGLGLCGLPLFHINGVIVTGLLPWSAGCGVVLAGFRGYRDPALLAGFWQIVESSRVSYFSGVPTVYQTLADLPTDGFDLSSLSYAICGAAPLPQQVRHRFETSIGIPILEGYGLTEGACISTISPLGPHIPSSSIGLRLLGQEMKAAVLADDGAYVRDCAANEPGVILIRGPNVFKGYRDEDHNRMAWVDDPKSDRRWFNTGDLGYCDASGFWRLAGRRKELIIRGGHNIDPLIIESALLQHPAVAAAAAVGRPDARVGEVPVAYVQLRAGAVVPEAELVEAAARIITERAARPQDVRVLDALPLTAVGKPFKPALVMREIADVVRLEAAQLDGLALVSVTVEADKKRGTVSRIAVRGSKASIQAFERRLGDYSFGYELTSVT